VTSKRLRILFITIAACVGVSGCFGGTYDCQNQEVQNTLIDTLRENYYNTLPNVHGGLFSIFSNLKQAEETQKAISVVKPDENSKEALAQLSSITDEIQSKTKYIIEELYESAANQRNNTYSCGAKLRMTLQIPKKIIESSKIVTFSSDETSGTIDVNFIVRPELSGNAKFNLEVSLK
jgi:hypothetical protein